MSSSSNRRLMPPRDTEADMRGDPEEDTKADTCGHFATVKLQGGVEASAARTSEERARASVRMWACGCRRQVSAGPI
jgi:hypothetical protein